MNIEDQISKIISDLEAHEHFELPIGVAQQITDPVARPPWITKEDYRANELKDMVSNCLQRGDVHPTPWEKDTIYKLYQTPILLHAKRIAWFIINGWNDPICYDFGCPDFGYHPSYPVSDGNHRLYAAIFKGDTSVKSSYEGQLENGLNMIRFAYEQQEILNSPIKSDMMKK
jgi:hypothetical protein